MTYTFVLHRLTHERGNHFDNHFLRSRFHGKALKNPLPMRLHPCFIDCPANRWGSAFLNSLEAMTDCSLPLDLRHYPKSHLCFTSLSQDFEFRDQQNPFVFFANWLALPSINHRNHAVLIWTGEASIASPDSTHRFLPDPYFGHGNWINVFPSKISIAIVMFWFYWKFLFGHNNNVQVLYFHR